MTVFCWDGNTLAADSRCTIKNTYRDTSKKLKTRFGFLTFQGSPIRAMARAGNRRQTRLLYQALKGSQITADNLRQLWDSGVLSRVKKGVLFIITEDKRWVLRVEPNVGISLKEVTKQMTVAGGSGGELGKFLMDTYGLSAQDAVRITKQYRTCCGGPTRFIHFNGAPLAVLKQIATHELALINENVTWFAQLSKVLRDERIVNEWPYEKKIRLTYASSGSDAEKFLMFGKTIKEILRISEILPSTKISQGFVVRQ